MSETENNEWNAKVAMSRTTRSGNMGRWMPGSMPTRQFASRKPVRRKWATMATCMV